MENKNSLRSLVEKIIEKKEITDEEQRMVNALAVQVPDFSDSDFDAISKLTEMICAGSVRIAGAGRMNAQ